MTAPRYRPPADMLTVVAAYRRVCARGCDTGIGRQRRRSAAPVVSAGRNGCRAAGGLGHAAFAARAPRVRRPSSRRWSRRQPKTFAIAVGGASVYALCTVASSIVIRWVIDHVIVPRFEEGDVAVATVVTGCALIIGVGVLRAIGVVDPALVRRHHPVADRPVARRRRRRPARRAAGELAPAPERRPARRPRRRRHRHHGRRDGADPVRHQRACC